MVTRWLIAFGRFWWDFLVGDTPELFVGVLVVVGVTIGLIQLGLRDVAVALTPVLVFVLLIASVLRSRPRGPRA